jgi:hypothetical protein
MFDNGGIAGKLTQAHALLAERVDRTGAFD